MTRKEFTNIFNSFSSEDKLFIAKQIQAQMAEKLIDIAAYKKAKQKPGKSIPFEEAFRQIEAYHSRDNDATSRKNNPIC